jgi:hypothetical protein
LGKPTKPACNIVSDQSNGKSLVFHKRAAGGQCANLVLLD